VGGVSNWKIYNFKVIYIRVKHTVINARRVQARMLNFKLDPLRKLSTQTSLLKWRGWKAFLELLSMWGVVWRKFKKISFRLHLCTAPSICFHGDALNDVGKYFSLLRSAQTLSEREEKRNSNSTPFQASNHFWVDFCVDSRSVEWGRWNWL
jgi:hypothetical protein